MTNYLVKLLSLEKKSILILLSFFLSNLGSYMAMPFFVIFLNQELNIPSIYVAGILSIGIALHQGLMLFGGPLADKLGYKWSMAIGLLFRGFSYVIYSLASNPIEVIIGSIFFGVGSSLFTPSGKAALADTLKEENMLIGFSIRNSVIDTASMIGPLVGSLFLMNRNYIDLFLIASSLQFIGFIVPLLYISSNRSSNNINSSGVIHNFFSPVRNIRFLKYVISTSVYFISYAVFAFVMPLYIGKNLDQPGVVGVLFTTMSLTGIITQLISGRALARIRSSYTIYAIGMFFFAIGILFLCAVNIPFLIISSIFIGIAEAVIVPSIDNYTVNVAPKATISSYFGFAGISGMIGGILGNYIGGLAIEFYQNKIYFLWLFLSVVCVIFIGILVYVIWLGNGKTNKNLEF